ncbi:hypothetical protein OS493_026792 [Desmophyllum pertusum]|uniref:Uncharacterized protein n=1 Tax=Desmophyllum pertusum TaxID=174260 RepID=A0A9X0D1E6_9CNID|nr:hypothetical protein OS493_026792 [Desmophyllum pertusum]
MNCIPLSLRAMCAIFLHQRHPRLQRSLFMSKENLTGPKEDLIGSKEDFTDREILYAATDAWASLRVYEEMKRTAEVLGIPLSPPLKSTMDVFRKKYNRSNRRKMNKDWTMGKCRNF